MGFRRGASGPDASTSGCGSQAPRPGPRGAGQRDVGRPTVRRCPPNPAAFFAEEAAVQGPTPVGGSAWGLLAFAMRPLPRPSVADSAPGSPPPARRPCLFPSHLKCRAPLRPRRGAGAPLVTEAPGVPRPLPRPAGGAGVRSARPGSESERPGRHRGPQAEAQASPPTRAEVAHWLSFRGPSERWVAGPPRCRRGASLCCALRAEASSLEGTASARRSSGPAALSGGDGASGAWGCRSGPWKTPESSRSLAPLASRVRDASSVGRFCEGG